ncbi:MAG: hypothetical protein CSA22_10390 [Deltaproteobacteria bacterium]|nr:MAG: hypothetical protein CSA22_10390 [Deltaproteobacteria bacterium]
MRSLAQPRLPATRKPDPCRRRRSQTELNRKLLGYSAAASAALALSFPAPADAVVRYSGPKNIIVPNNATVYVDMQDTWGGTPDGQWEFRFQHDSGYHSLPIYGVRSSCVMLNKGHCYASIARLSASTLLPEPGQPDPFVRGGRLAAVNYNTNGSPATYMYQFINTSGYIGVKFKVDTHTHYGWIQFKSTLPPLTGTIIDWAYEDQPDTPIHIGDKAPPPIIPAIPLLLLQD